MDGYLKKIAQHFVEQLKLKLSGNLRMRYNQAVRGYSVSLKVFPSNIIAGMFGFVPVSEYFKAEEKAKAVPEVKF